MCRKAYIYLKRQCTYTPEASLVGLMLFRDQVRASLQDEQAALAYQFSCQTRSHAYLDDSSLHRDDQHATHPAGFVSKWKRMTTREMQTYQEYFRICACSQEAKSFLSSDG